MPSCSACKEVRPHSDRPGPAEMGCEECTQPDWYMLSRFNMNVLLCSLMFGEIANSQAGQG